MGLVSDQCGSLSGEQRAMMGALCSSGDGVQVVIGVAGPGKTYALGVAYEAWRSSGIRVIGTALSARAAQELSQGAGIYSFTIAKLTAEMADPAHGGLVPGSVLVVDEAAMVSSRDLAVGGHRTHPQPALTALWWSCGRVGKVFLTGPR